MRIILSAAILMGVLASSAIAQTASPSTATPNKPDMNCNTASTAPGAAQTTGTTSMAVEKSAILPSAGNHASSAAPTVQSDGKPMEARPDCPPETKK